MSGALHAGATDVGRRREHNEDAILSTPPLFAVADGVGGAAKGEVASSTALDVFAQAGAGVRDAADGDAARAEMVEVVLRCNNSVHAAQAEEPDRAGMATTLTAAVLREGGEVVLGHVGDSRAYAIDARGGIRQITDDHSLVGELVRAGQMSAEEAAVHPHRNVITRALGPESDVQVDAFVTTLGPGEWLLLCSDGLTGHVADDELAQAVLGAASPDTAVQQLIALANERGGSDNISVVLVRPLPPGAHAGGDPSTAATAAIGQRDVELSGELRLRPIDATDTPGGDAPGSGATAQQDAAWQHAPIGNVETTQAIAAVPATPPARNPADPRGTAQPRPTPPPVQQPSVRARYVRRLLVLLFIMLVAFVAGAVAWRQSYYVAEQDGGRVGINQGFPVLGLHREYRSSDVHTSDLEPADRERYVEEHTLRSREDAERIFDRLPELAGRCDIEAPGAGTAGGTTLRDPNC